MEKSEAELLDTFIKSNYKDSCHLHNDQAFRSSVRNTIGFASFMILESAKNVSLEIGKSINGAMINFKRLIRHK